VARAGRDPGTTLRQRVAIVAGCGRLIGLVDGRVASASVSDIELAVGESPASILRPINQLG
jgi:hypothetical protein